MSNDNFYDIAYNFNYDNPFPNDSSKQKLNTLKKMVKQNLAISLDDIDTVIKFYDLNTDITQLYNMDDKKTPITDTLMFNDIKQVIMSISELKYFNSWVDKYNTIQEPNISGGDVQEETTNDEDTKEVEAEAEVEVEKKKTVFELPQEETRWETVIPITPTKFDYSKTGGLTNYDITNEKPLSYEDIRKLTVNIARSKLKNIVEKSEQVL